MKIEDKVKEIVGTSETLSIREKSDIICLIECYKNVDNLTKLCIEKITQSITSLEEVINFINYNEDFITCSGEIIEQLNCIIKNLKKGLL